MTDTKSVGAEVVAGLQAALPIAKSIAGLFMPGSAVIAAGLSLDQLFNLASGLIAEEPAVESLASTVEAIATGGPAPTVAEFAVIDADQIKASARLAAANAKIIAKAAGA